MFKSFEEAGLGPIKFAKLGATVKFGPPTDDLLDDYKYPLTLIGMASMPEFNTKLAAQLDLDPRNIGSLNLIFAL